jgi:predicted HicB family RNase H-like nuclease
MTRQIIQPRKTLEEKIAEMSDEKTTLIQEPTQQFEVIKSSDLIEREQEQAMKKYNLVKVRKGSRVDIDEDLHKEFKIAAIRSGKSQKDWLEELIREAVFKAKRKFEK